MTGYRKVKAFLSAVLTALVVSACAAVRPGAALGPSVILWMSAGADTPQQPVLSAIAEAIPGCEVSVLQPGSPGIRRCAAEGRLRAERLATPSADDLAEVGLQMGGRVVVHLPASPGGAYIVVDAVGRDAVRVAGDAAADRLGPAVSAFFGRRPATAGEFYRLGRILLARNDAAGAVDALSDAVALAPAVAEYRGWLLRALVSAGRLGEAEHQAKRALKVGRTDPTALMAAAELECVRGRWTQALALAERASALDDPPPGVHRLLGDICTALGRTLRAVEEYRLAKDDPAACTALAALLMKQGQFDEAATAAQAALASEPENVRAKELLANAYSGAERYADAVRQRSLIVLDAVEKAREERSSRRCAGGKGTLYRGPLRLAPTSEAGVARTVRALLVDIEAGVHQVVTGQRPKGALYRALQESLLASDRLQAEISDGFSADGDGTVGRYRLAYSLWSQAAYELIKALDGDDPRAALVPLELIRHAVRELDDAARMARRSEVAK